MMQEKNKRSGRFGKMPDERARQFILSEHTPEIVWDAYRRMLVNLSGVLPESTAASAVVTSCSPSEGKSTTCVNLAVAVAEAGARVLLIDCDMRRPALHLLLQLDNSIGLSTYLSGMLNEVTDVLHRDVRSGLDVITAGDVPEDPAALLYGTRTDSLMSFAAANYDWIFIDTPPVKAVTDAFLLNGRTGGLVFVVREGSTRRDELRKCLNAARLANAKVLGVIRTNCGE